MEQITIRFNLVLGGEIPGFPSMKETAGLLREGAALPPPPPGPPPEVPVKIPQQVSLTRQEDGTVTGHYLHPRWGEQDILHPVWTGSCIAFDAPSGNDDKGGGAAWFHFVLALNESTRQVVGFSSGREPFFRSFLPLEGEVLSPASSELL